MTWKLLSPPDIFREEVKRVAEATGTTIRMVECGNYRRSRDEGYCVRLFDRSWSDSVNYDPQQTKGKKVEKPRAGIVTLVLVVGLKANEAQRIENTCRRRRWPVNLRHEPYGSNQACRVQTLKSKSSLILLDRWSSKSQGPLPFEKVRTVNGVSSAIRKLEEFFGGPSWPSAGAMAA